jgi:serine/threonine protein kinase
MKPLEPGEAREIGGYQLLCRLGEGGMGRVYLGESDAGTAVAVKVIHPEYARDGEFLARFQSEVKAAKKVSGAYTAPVVDAGPDDDPPWLATAFVAGPSLAEAVAEKGPLPIDAIWRLTGGLIEALRAVHACGLVHRDLKPANVLLAATGPKVIDFGISQGLAGSGLTSPGLTSPGGSGPGTPGFMAPEQLIGRGAGPESDVYALGKVIAYAATGSSRVVDSIGFPLRERDGAGRPGLADIPPEVRGLVAGCLAQHPAYRPSLDRLMAEVRAGRARYPQASPLNFWREPLATLVRSKEEDLRRRLTSGPPEGPARADVPPAVYTPTARAPVLEDIHFRPTQTRWVPRPSGRPPAAGARPATNPPSRAARGPDGVLFAAYRPYAPRAGVINRGAAGRHGAVAHAMEGERHWTKWRYEEAEDAYRASIKLDPTDPVVHVDLGRTLYAMQRLMDAEASFLKALDLVPGLIAARRNLCITLENMTGRFKDASRAREDLEDACREVTGLAPADPAGYANVGDAHCCLAEYPEAVEAYRMALSLDHPDNDRLLGKLSYAQRARAR